ncbi:MAG: NUDIX domain-containing protein [Candidatus Margulisiibacteriota bacterium]
MEKLAEKEMNSRKVFEGKLLRLRVDKVLLPTGKEATREVVEHPGAVAVVAITKEQELVLVRQYRKAAGEVLLEIPAGVPRAGEKDEEAARRELEEETGYHAKKMIKVWEGFASPGYSNEVIRYFLAQDMIWLKPKTEEDEIIEVDLVETELCLDLVRTGKIKDNKTIIGVLIANLFLRGELFAR